MRLLRTASEPKTLTKDEVETLVSKLARLAAGQPVVLLYLHGSHARGVQSALSDVDIALLLDPAVSRDNKLQLDLLFSLQEACGREDVDLVILNRAGPMIKDMVVRHGSLVFARREKERILFEAAAIKEALDFQHFSRVYDDALFRQLEEGRFLG